MEDCGISLRTKVMYSDIAATECTDKNEQKNYVGICKHDIL